MSDVSRPNEPTIAELVEAVRERIEGVADAPLGVFEARVIRNVLGIVERELALGSSAEAAHGERLRSLDATDDADLAEAIRAGRHDDQLLVLCDALAAAAVDRLEINNPRWLS